MRQFAWKKSQQGAIERFANFRLLVGLGLRVAGRKRNHRFEQALLNDLIVMVDQLTAPKHNSSPFVLGRQLHNLRHGVHRVTEENGLEKLPLANLGEGLCLHPRAAITKPGNEREPEQAMRNGLAKRRLRREMMINMQRIKITRKTSKLRDVTFGDRTGGSRPGVADLQLVEIERLLHVDNCEVEMPASQAVNRFESVTDLCGFRNLKS